MAEAYQALRRFHRLADQPHLRLSFRLDPGQILCFDNRRILHGRKAFSGSGTRHLQGIYIDRDDVLSKVRALNRSRAAKKSETLTRTKKIATRLGEENTSHNDNN